MGGINECLDEMVWFESKYGVYGIKNLDWLFKGF